MPDAGSVVLLPKQTGSEYEKIPHVTPDINRRPPARETSSDLLVDKSSRRTWEMLAVWGYVVLSFAALLLCLRVISLKCHTSLPF